MSSGPKVVQLYLERHGIGQLFEDMMAKLIKEMPNEPLPYLLKLLQRMYQKKMQRADSSFSGTGFRTDMGLVGSSIPKKYSKDPQVVLPGSKQPVSSWATSDLDYVGSEDIKSSKSRDYEKPWQTKIKPAKGKDNKGSRVDPKSWNDVTKVTASSFDDVFEQPVDPHKNPLVKSLPVALNEPIRQKKGKGHGWSEGSSYDKENNPPYAQPTRMAADDEDELKIETSFKGKKMKISPAAYSKFKKQNSKKKSVEQKQKLQALLSNGDKPKTNRKSNDEDSTDDDEVEVLESKADLANEGVNSKTSVGIKRPIHVATNSSSDVKVSVCSRCAKMMGSNPSEIGKSNGVPDSDYLFNSKSNNSFVEAVNSDDDDFDSVSQIDNNTTYRPKWPTITDSEGEDVENITAKLTLKDPLVKSSFKKGVNFQTSGMETDKSDFFENNSPLRKKTKQTAATIFTSDDESKIFPTTKSPSHRVSPRHSRNPKQAWNQQVPETESDVDEVVTLRQETKLKARGWKQKQAIDDASDVL